ncbi:MAG: DUF3536 domain-containing protein [Bacteroidota bacterium]
MSKAKKYLCVHGHFYQPPRENAWLEVVELQDSAQPFHDWNERINFECYAPNTAARILGEEDKIVKILNNYTRISFNFGPTLLSWMEHADPETYLSIVLADRESRQLYSGHGSAMAQAHSHLILPLCNERDKHTQIIWGIRDFEYRFSRPPEGMWLAETAVNTESLEVLAEHGIKYTVLAPRQAKAFRKSGSNDWIELPHAGVDTKRPYWCHLPSGKKIALFFYDGEVAQGVAFKGLLNNGKSFANNLVSQFDNRQEAQLVNIATDGESYGHHHRHGEMALADALNYIEENNLATITNYGEFLELFPPEYEILIHENSSWSCVHGVERWRSNCGCNTGGQSHWHQQWRKPLRDALDWLRDTLIPVFERTAAKLVKDPWTARNNYISIITDRSRESIDRFIRQHASKKLSKDEIILLLRLMEMQRNTMYMYTSCGWFFNEISGIETHQILQYALRALDYAAQVADLHLHEDFENRLKKAPSNVYENGAVSYRKNVVPTRVGLIRAGMHYAVSSLFEKKLEKLSLFNYTAINNRLTNLAAGKEKLSIGQTTMKSKITLSEKHFTFAVIYLGQQNIIGNISTDMSEETFLLMQKQLTDAFNAHNLGEIMGLMQQYFGPEKYSFRNLFRDEQRRILKRIALQNMKRAEKDFRNIYNNNYQLMSSMLLSNIPIPKAYQSVAQFIINTDLHRFFVQEELKLKELRRLSDELQKWPVTLGNEQSFKLAASERIYYEIKTIAHNIVPLQHLHMLNSIFEILGRMGMELDIWKSQNIYFSITQGFRNGENQFPNEEWKAAFQELGKWLKVDVRRLVASSTTH